MRTIALAPLALAAALGLQACAYDPYYSAYGPPAAHDGYGDYAYAGGDYADEGPLSGRGVDRLDPWLAETEEGQRIVRLGFQASADGYVDDETAERINIWFRRYADTDRDLRLTDDEIRAALVQASRDRGGEPEELY